jgi:hypothetical protein
MSRHEYESWYQARAWSPSPASGLHASLYKRLGLGKTLSHE